MRKEIRNLVIFFVVTFVWTWAFYTLIAVSSNSPYQMPWMILLILGGAGPSIVGVAMVLLKYEKERRHDYWRRCFSLRRISWLWWLVIFPVFPAIFVASFAVDRTMGGAMPGMEQLKSLMINPMMWPLAAFISFMSGPWSEEFGWRGYALDPIMRRLGTIPGTVSLGLIWAVWHLPLYFMPATWHGQMGFKLAEALQVMRDSNINIHSLMVIRNDSVILDAYFYPYDGQTPHELASVTKSVITTLIGIAADQGELKLNDRMVSFFSDRTIANRILLKNLITVRQLTAMSSGLACIAEHDEQTLTEMGLAEDWIQFSLDLKAAHIPGTRFTYCSPGMHLLSAILQEAAGTTAADFARTNLFEPLPPNPVGVTQLNDTLSAILEPPLPQPVSPLPETAETISGKTFVFEPNPLNLSSLRFDFDETTEARLLVTFSKLIESSYLARYII